MVRIDFEVSFYFSILDFPIRVIFRLTFNRANEKQSFQMSYGHRIHVMLAHAVDLADNMHACAIFMASHTGIAFDTDQSADDVTLLTNCF